MGYLCVAGHAAWNGLDFGWRCDTVISKEKLLKRKNQPDDEREAQQNDGECGDAAAPAICLPWMEEMDDDAYPAQAEGMILAGFLGDNWDNELEV